MRNLVNELQGAMLWALFFVTSVYGHVALKFAVLKVQGGGYRQVLLAAATNFWGWSAFLAWTFSCVLWVLALARQQLMTANSISSFRYVLICLAAWSLLSEEVTWPQWLGMAFITCGIILVK